MNWKRASLSAACAVPLLALFAWGFTRDPREIPSPLPGHRAPAFALTVFMPGESALARPVGDTLRLSRLHDTVVVMNFYASWCLACRDEHAVLSQVARTYRGKPVQFVGVLYSDTPATAVSWIKEMGGESYPSTTDAESRTAIDYGLYGVPETFFIDRTGRIARKQTGPATAEVLTAVVDSLLTNRLDVSAVVAPAVAGDDLASLPERPGSAATDSALDAQTAAVASRLRCPVCQGLSIQDSPSELAQQMRAVVREQLRAGKSAAEVEAYFVSKYGEWILLQPKPAGFNLTVYLLPFVLIVGGLAGIGVAVRRWSRRGTNGPAISGSPRSRPYA